MCNVDYAEPVTLYREGVRRSAKDRPCGDCGRTISKGEKHHYATGLNAEEGMWFSTHVCAHCKAAAWWLSAVCGGWIWTEVGSENIEHWEEGYRDLTLGRLIVGYRRKWQRWDGTLMPLPQPKRIVWSESTSGWREDRHILRYEPLRAAA